MLVFKNPSASIVQKNPEGGATLALDRTPTFTSVYIAHCVIQKHISLTKPLNKIMSKKKFCYVCMSRERFTKPCTFCDFVRGIDASWLLFCHCRYNN